MLKITALGASSSRNSINKKFAHYVATRLGNNVNLLDLNDYEMPMYSIDHEIEEGIPGNAVGLYKQFEQSDVIVISLAEHNGSYTSVFKNAFDWISRVDRKCFGNKKVVLLSAATGPRGGLTVLQAAAERFPRHGADIVGTFCLPRFKETFDELKGIIDPELRESFEGFLSKITIQIPTSDLIQ